MNYYELLAISEDASIEEIEQAYKNLKEMYNPSFNTSPKTFAINRKLDKAYKHLIDVNERKIYDLELKNKKEIAKEKEREEYELYNFSNIESNLKENIDNDKNMNVGLINKYPLIGKDIIYKKEVSYLDFLLETTQTIKVKYYKTCEYCQVKEERCSHCDDLGKIIIDNKEVLCPWCDGTKKIKTYKCDRCNNFSKYLVEENMIFVLENTNNTKQEFILNECGEFGKNGGKNGNLIIEFYCLDKENIKVENNVINVNYKLNKDELKNGLNKEYKVGDETLIFSVDKKCLKDYKITKRIKDKTIVFDVITSFYNGEDKKGCLFIKRKDLEKGVYLDPKTFKLSFAKQGEDVYILNNDNYLDLIRIKGYGEEGFNGGENGDLLIKVVLTSKRINNQKIKDKEKIFLDTSLMFNLLGGQSDNLFNFGFKGKNAIINRKNKVYILSGQKQEKKNVYNYFLINLVMLVIWISLFLLLFLLPFNKQNILLITLLILVYGIISNVILKLKI